MGITYSEEEQAIRDKLISQIEEQMTTLSEILTGKDEE